MRKNLNNLIETSNKTKKSAEVKEIKENVSKDVKDKISITEAINNLNKKNLIVIEWQKELLAREKISKIPKLVEKYLKQKNPDRRKAEWKNFKFEITEDSNSVSGHWIAYLNKICIDYKDNNIYDSWMMQYRWAYAKDIDNWDKQIFDPVLLEENEDKAIFGHKTWEWNIKIVEIDKDWNKNTIDIFNIRDYEKIKEKSKLIKNVLNEPKSRDNFISKDLESKWYMYDSSSLSFENDNIVLKLVWHADRDYDAIDDKYMFYAWIKWVGIGKSKEFYTWVNHPDGRFYRCKVYDKDAQIVWRWLLQDGIEFIKIKILVAERQWSEDRIITIVFKSNREFNEKVKFENEVFTEIEECVSNHSHNHPLFKPTKVTEKIIDSDKKIAAWILFEQIDTDRNTPEGEWWLGDQFRYSLWIKKDNLKAIQVFEDHAYIRPRSISQLTWTRWRDSTIKNLKINKGKIQVLCSGKENIEKQEWIKKEFKM